MSRYRTDSPARALPAALGALLGALALLFPAPRLEAQPAARQPGAAPLTIVSPPAGVPAFGALEVVVDPGGTVPRKVEFWFNGIKAGETTRAPWQLTIETGEENIERRLRVVATDPGGQRREAELVLPSIHVDDELDLPLQQLYITATREGRPAADLKRRDFAVFDMEHKQDIVTFEHGDIPLTAVLLIDSSVSMVGPPLRAALAGAQFVAAGGEEPVAPDALVRPRRQHVGARQKAVPGHQQQTGAEACRDGPGVRDEEEQHHRDEEEKDDAEHRGSPRVDRRRGCRGRERGIRRRLGSGHQSS